MGRVAASQILQPTFTEQNQVKHTHQVLLISCFTLQQVDKPTHQSLLFQEVLLVNVFWLVTLVLYKWWHNRQNGIHLKSAAHKHLIGTAVNAITWNISTPAYNSILLCKTAYITFYLFVHTRNLSTCYSEMKWSQFMPNSAPLEKPHFIQYKWQNNGIFTYSPFKGPCLQGRMMGQNTSHAGSWRPTVSKHWRQAIIVRKNSSVWGWRSTPQNAAATWRMVF